MSYSGCGGLNMGFAVHTDMATPPIHLLGTEELKQRYLPASIAARRSAASGSPSRAPAPTWRASAPRPCATATSTSINGAKTFITNGPRADYIVLVTKTDPDKGHDGISLFVVDLKDEDGNHVEGFTVSAELEKMGMHASDTGELGFDDVRVPVENMLGEEGRGFYHISWELQGERLVAAAGCVAGAERMFERTLEYAMEREAFGRPIGRFQAIRHKFAEMSTQIEAAKQFTYSTAWRFANGEYPVREISQAKLFTSQMVCDVADECIQIHGGYGYMKEYEIERAYRDARLNRIGAGTDEIMLEVIGRSYGL